jgi:HSP20 family protein
MTKQMASQTNWLHQTISQDPLRQLFDRLFDGGIQQNGNEDSNVVTSQWTPHVDIKEEPDRFVLLADIPGVEPSDIEVQMERGMLAIKGERTLETRSEGTNFSRVERRHGLFHRRFALPDSANPEGITASGRNGVLEIVIPKRPETTPRRIQVGNTLNS